MQNNESMHEMKRIKIRERVNLPKYPYSDLIFHQFLEEGNYCGWAVSPFLDDITAIIMSSFNQKVMVHGHMGAYAFKERSVDGGEAYAFLTFELQSKFVKVIGWQVQNIFTEIKNSKN